jgi:hypothetical protein
MVTIQKGTWNHLNLVFSYHFGWFQALLLESRGRRIRHRILDIEELSIFLALIAGCRLPSYSPVFVALISACKCCRLPTYSKTTHQFHHVFCTFKGLVCESLSSVWVKTIVPVVHHKIAGIYGCSSSTYSKRQKDRNTNEYNWSLF